MSEALIFASTNPQYDDRLFIVHENCKLSQNTSRIFCVQKWLFLFYFDIQNNFGTQHVLQMLRTFEKDLPVQNGCTRSRIHIVTKILIYLTFYPRD